MSADSNIGKMCGAMVRDLRRQKNLESIEKVEDTKENIHHEALSLGIPV